jgi:hypothetical protein
MDTVSFNDNTHQNQQAEKSENNLNTVNHKVDYIDYSFVGKSQFNYKSGYSEYGYSDAELRQFCKFHTF